MRMFPNYTDLEGLDLRDKSKHFFNVTGFFDTSRTIALNDLYSDGKSLGKSKTNEKKVQLNGWVKGIDNFLNLRGVLNKSGLKKLTVGVPGMPTTYLMVELENIANDDAYPQKLSIQLVAPDPYLYELTARTISLGAVSNNGLNFPLIFPIVFGDLSGAQGTISNVGNAIAYPVITIVGTCSNIVITNTTTGESMSLNISLLDTDTLIMDSRPDTRGIYLNGVKRMDLKNGFWLSCPPGDNVFSFNRNSLQTKQHCSIELQSRWA